MLTETLTRILLFCVLGTPLVTAARTEEDCQSLSSRIRFSDLNTLHFQIALSLESIVKGINVTDRFFWPPETYQDYADKCEEMFNCAREVSSSKLTEIQENASECLFYIYYNREFSTCANKLIAKKDTGILCLNTLFNDIHEPEVDLCDQWNGLQLCIKEQIGKLCDDKNGTILKEYIKQEKNVRKEFCDNFNGVYRFIMYLFLWYTLGAVCVLGAILVKRIASRTH